MDHTPSATAVPSPRHTLWEVAPDGGGALSLAITPVCVVSG